MNKKRFFLMKTALALFMALFSVWGWGQTTTFFNFSGTSGYLVPPADGWASAGTGTAGGGYLKLAPGSVTSPEYAAATNVVFKYDIAAFGSGTTSSSKLYVLDAADNNVIIEYTLTTANSSTYIKAQVVNVGTIAKAFKVRIEGLGTGAGASSIKGTRLQNYSLVGNIAQAGPVITATPTSVGGFTYIEGSGPSAEKSFSLSGSNLTNDITATAPASFELSKTTGSGFADVLTFTQTDGSVASTTVYARMKAGLSPTTYSGNIALSSTDAPTVNIALSGTVTLMPVKPVITTPVAQTGTVGVAYTYQIAASENPTSYALASGTLPTGFTLNTTTGVIAGTPTAAGAFNATITATNAAGTSDPVAFDFNISKGTQTVVLSDLNLTVGGADVTLPAITDKGITILYSSSNPAVASITGNTLTIGEAGSATISASNAGNADYEAFSAIFTVNVATAPCGVEDFSNIGTSTSYGEKTWAGFGGTWTATDAREDQTINDKAITIRTGVLTSPEFTTGIGNLTMTTQLKFSGSAGDLTVRINGLSVGTIAYSSTDGTFSINNINIAGNFIITVENTTGNRVAIDDLAWTCFADPSTTWNGTWSDGAPDATMDAIISADYNEAAAINAKSLTVNAGVKLVVNTFVETGNVTNNGEITVANNANFVHTGTFTAGTSSAFKVNRLTNPVQRLDYNSWSSPLKNSAQTLKQFSPATLDARFLTYDNGLYQSVTNPAVATFNAAQGYLIRTPNNYTTTPEVFSGVFEGTEPNAGPVSYDPSGITGDFVFLGNPYPSAISMADFVTANPQIDGTFYIWDSSVKMIDNAYSGNNYVTHTSAGSVPEGSPFFVPVAQGFFVNRGASANALTFNNAMRRTVETGVFAKEALATDRFWLQMTAPSGAKPQMLIGFFQNGTAGYDTGLDGKMFETNADVIYSNVDNNSLIINALGTFNTDEKVNVTANFLADGNYTIGLAQKEGIFAGSQKIYLKDNVTGTETELTAGDYSFAATAGLQKDRFTVYFKFVVLGNSDVTVNQSIIYVSGHTVHAKASTKIATLEVYDMSGKVMKKNTNINSNNASIPMTYKGVALVKMVLENGETVTKKIILN